MGQPFEGIMRHLKNLSIEKLEHEKVVTEKTINMLTVNLQFERAKLNWIEKYLMDKKGV